MNNTTNTFLRVTAALSLSLVSVYADPFTSSAAPAGLAASDPLPISSDLTRGSLSAGSQIVVRGPFAASRTAQLNAGVAAEVAALTMVNPRTSRVLTLDAFSTAVTKTPGSASAASIYSTDALSATSAGAVTVSTASGSVTTSPAIDSATSPATGSSIATQLIGDIAASVNASTDLGTTSVALSPAADPTATDSSAASSTTTSSPSGTSGFGVIDASGSPEPATFGLVGAFVAALALRKRR